MLFEKIAILDEHFAIQEQCYLGTAGVRIAYIGTVPPPEPERYGEIYDGCGKLLMPGFYNAHGHSPMTILRGYGENLALDQWLNTRIFPFEAKLYGEAVYWGTLLAMAESLRTGIVSTSDMYFFLDDMARAVAESGMKANLCRSVTSIDGVSPADNQTLREMRSAIRSYDGMAEGRIRMDASLHAEYTNDAATISAVAETAAEMNVGVHVHVAETEQETLACRDRHDGQSPVAYLDSLGLFAQGGIAAHAVWVDEADRAILRDRRMTVASNPASNLKLCSGICDVPALWRTGVSVAVGTDSVSSNNSLNFFEEMKLMALLGKLESKDPAAMEPRSVLYSATRAGALAQGRTEAGLIREGYRADLIVIDTETPNMQPVYDLRNNLVYSASPAELCLTMVDGRVLYRDGKHESLDVERISAELRQARNKILAKL